MRIQTVALMLAGLAASATITSPAQQRTPDSEVTPKLDVGLGFDVQRANAPPGVSDDFGLAGGRAGVAYHFNGLFAVAAEFSGAHANTISSAGQNLTLTTYTFGPRVTLPHHRVAPFGEALFGAGHGSNSYFPAGTTYTTSANSFAYSFGGGVDVNLTHRIAIRAVEAQYLHTGFPNGSSNEQHQLAIGAGIVLKFGGRRELAPPPPVAAVVTPEQGDIHFSCSLNVKHVAEGGVFLVLGETMTEPYHPDVMYTWMPQAGMIEGSGREVKLWTSGLAPGTYMLKGHAAVVGDYNLAADCELPFQVDAPVVAAAAPVPPPPAAAAVQAAQDKEFHANVPDAYFEYNSAILRPDAFAATLHAADFLNQHEDMRVRVEGFADERGSVEYNLMLGQQRADAAREALIKAGVAADRVQIVSYGKADPVCTQSNEACYQQNRRAAFSLHP